MSDKLNELGIPQSDITPAVSIAVSGLLDHIESLTSQLQLSLRELEDFQKLVDIDSSPIIPNRKSFIKRLRWAIAMMKRHQSPTSAVVFRIDNYSEIQNSYGFAASKETANHVASILSDSLRDTDFFAKLEQEKFGTIMFFAEFENVKNKAQRLCQQVRSRPFEWNNSVIDIEINFGAHLIDSSDDAESALLDATNALYVEKQKQNFTKTDYKA